MPYEVRETDDNRGTIVPSTAGRSEESACPAGDCRNADPHFRESPAAGHEIAEVEKMKVISAALIAIGLLAVSSFDPFNDPRLALPRSADTQQSMLMTGNAVVAQAPGTCCNDDFRQALPLSESPIDPQVAKP
jgi:hypothetical protein